MSLSQYEEVKQAAEASLSQFIKLVDKNRVLGHVHEDVIDWWERSNRKKHQLLLLPRDHMKSALVAFRVAWYLTKDPTLRVLYVSSTSNLAVKQLSFIKNIFESDTHRKYWPEHIHPDEGKRTKWTETEIALDHPLRKEHFIRDPSIFAGGIGTAKTGMHCDIAVFDDVVVFENAYDKTAREKLKVQYSLLASIEGADTEEWVVGTRYHPKDLYNDMQEMTEDVYDKDGQVVDSREIYDVFERAVEDQGDGTGSFLWPRQQRYDGKWFGFNKEILARKRAQYLDKAQFRAQYYNDPTDPENRPIDYDKFQYFEPANIRIERGTVYYKGKQLNLAAAVDFAFSTSKRADSTAVVVVGMDSEGYTYVLDIDRFKTDGKISDYYKSIIRLMQKWPFRKLAAETTVAQKAIVRELKSMYLIPNGLNLKIIENSPIKNKEERVAAVLEPRYEEMMMYHRRGGNWEILEEELVSRNPAHDDVKDALAMAVEICVKPAYREITNRTGTSNVVYHPRFGGRI